MASDESWKEDNSRNVFQMLDDANGPGIWVRRTTWEASCARIVAMGRATKPPPYYGNPSVLMDVYNLKGDLREELASLDTAGTYKTWRQIEPPAWAQGDVLRPLNDPRIADALAAVDKKRGKNRSEPPRDRIELKVTFADKDKAKKLGARWDPQTKTWWLPGQATAKIKEQARKLGFLS